MPLPFPYSEIPSPEKISRAIESLSADEVLTLAHLLQECLDDYWHNEIDTDLYSERLTAFARNIMAAHRSISRLGSANDLEDSKQTIRHPLMEVLERLVS